MIVSLLGSGWFSLFSPSLFLSLCLLSYTLLSWLHKLLIAFDTTEFDCYNDFHAEMSLITKIAGKNKIIGGY